MEHFMVIREDFVAELTDEFKIKWSATKGKVKEAKLNVIIGRAQMENKALGGSMPVFVLVLYKGVNKIIELYQPKADDIVKDVDKFFENHKVETY